MYVIAPAILNSWVHIIPESLYILHN